MNHKLEIEDIFCQMFVEIKLMQYNCEGFIIQYCASKIYQSAYNCLGRGVMKFVKMLFDHHPC